MAKSKASKAKATAWMWFSRYIRARDCMAYSGTILDGRCISCDKPVRFDEGDAGHFIPSRRDSILFEETNCHLQCRKCNRFEQGAWVEYESAMLLKYGPKEVDRLKSLKFTTVKLRESNYREIADKYRKKYKELIGEGN